MNFKTSISCEYDLMTVLCGYHKNLFIVGDPDQTIYTWRAPTLNISWSSIRRFPGQKQS